MTLDQSSFGEMEKRIGRAHLSKRLRRQVQHSAIRFGDAGFKFHLEHFELVFSVLRIMLKCLGILDRGMKNALGEIPLEGFKILMAHSPFSSNPGVCHSHNKFFILNEW